jgi:Ca2+-binding EF-hand superfamily protein
VWSYLTQTKSSLMMFAFDLYDNDGSGQLTLQEIEDMVYGVYGHDAAQNQYAGQIILDLQYRAGSLPGDSIFISLSEVSRCVPFPGAHAGFDRFTLT